jgi:hypothetical protein
MADSATATQPAKDVFDPERWGLPLEAVQEGVVGPCVGNHAAFSPIWADKSSWVASGAKGRWFRFSL